MLTLLRPWRVVTDIKLREESFATTFHSFYDSANQSDWDVISGIQYHYDCKNAVAVQTVKSDGIVVSLGEERMDRNTNDPVSMDDEDDKQGEMVFTESHLEVFKDSQKILREEQYVQSAITIGWKSHMFDDAEEQRTFSSQGITVASREEFGNIRAWEAAMKERVDELNKTIESHDDNGVYE